MDHRPLTRQHPLDRTTIDDAIIDNSVSATPLPQANPHFIPHASTRISNDTFTSANHFISPGQTLKHGLQSAIQISPRSLNTNQNCWQNGYNGGSLDQPGMRFYDSNIQPTLSGAPNIGNINSGDNSNNLVPLSLTNLPSQPTSLLYQTSNNNFNSIPTKSNQQVLPINPSNILPQTNDAIVTQTTIYNHQTDIPSSQATQYRQLPLMSTLIGNSGGGRSNSSLNIGITMDQQNINCIPTNANSQIPTYRRSLPPMAHITGAANQLYNVNTQRSLIKDYSHDIYPLTNDSAAKQVGNSTMRQLPIITPYGPKPIHRPSSRLPLRDTNETPCQPRPHPQPRPRISIQPSSIDVQQRSDFPYMAPSEIERKLPQDIGQNSKNNYPAEFQSHHQLSPLSAKAQTSPNNRISNQATKNVSQRQLPIITKQGVLKLRGNSSFVDNIENGPPQTRKRPSKPYNVQNAIINSPYISKVNKLDSTPQNVREDSKQKYLSNLTDSDNDYYDDDDCEQQGDLDTGEDDRISDDSVGESEEIVSSIRSEKEMEDDMDHEGYNDVIISECEPESINIYVNGDEFLEEDKNYRNDTKVIEDIDEEAEYFSALATVPEEEGKLSDKDNLEYDPCSEEGDEPSVKDLEDSSVRSNEISIGTNNKLPTIAENGFEAQVLEYIVEKTGMRRGELFSVDEEPSSYNDDSGSMESRADNGRQESLDISDTRLRTINDNSYRAKNDDSMKNNFTEQPIGQNDDCEPKSIQNDSMIQDSVGDFTDSKESNINRYTQQQFDLNRDSSLSDGRKADYGDHDNTKQNLIDSNEVILSATNYENNETLEMDQNIHIIKDNKTDNSNIQDPDGQTMVESNEHQFYNDQKILDYDLGEEEEEEEEDERILMSPNNNKTSFEQEEYDEQYRDINNLDDLDRRATNHVHAIDGHSKSMLNDIHQQRTIVDYYDENDFAMNNNNGNYSDRNNNLELEGPYDDHQEDDSRENYSKQGLEDLNDALERDSKDQEKEAEKEDDEARVDDDDFDPNLPRARVRWITAVNRIVNRFGEVSYIFEIRFGSVCKVEFFSCRLLQIYLIRWNNLYVLDSIIFFRKAECKSKRIAH